MAGQGRHTKLTEELQLSIVRDISAGVPMKYAAQRVGVTDRVTQIWRKKGSEQKKGIYFSFYSAIKKAEADAITRNVAIIQKAASTQWTAAAWWLERRHPDDFGSNRREIYELKKQVAMLTKAIKNVRLGNINPKGKAGSQKGGK